MTSIEAKLPSELASLLTDAEQCPDLEAVGRLFEHSAAVLKKEDLNLYSHRGFFVKLALELYSSGESSNLALVNKLGVRSAPQLVRHSLIGDGESLLVYFIPDLNDHVLQPCSEETSFSEAAQEQFLHDMELLLMAGLVHPYAARGYAHWHVNPGNGLIILDSWSALRQANENDREEVLDQINKLLG